MITLHSPLSNRQRRRYTAGICLILWLLITLSPLSALAEESEIGSGTIPNGKAQIYLPMLSQTAPPAVVPPVFRCPTTSTRSYELIPVLWPPADHPHEEHGDLNLALRSYEPSTAATQIVDPNGPTDGDPPQFPGLFGDERTPTFTSTHQVYDWNWACGEHGCRGALITSPEVSLLGLGTTQEETISIPSRGAQIYGGEFKALVLYAAEERITLGYTREDSVAPGYAVHIEKICLDPNLLALYRQANADGRGQLPALHNGEILGVAQGQEILVAIRDRGTFMEARSRKDWWRGR